MTRNWVFLLLCGIALGLLGCSPSPQVQPTPTVQPLDDQLILLHYVDGFPQSLLDKFTAETGIEVIYKGFGNYEEAEQLIRDGEEADVVWLSNTNLDALLKENLIAEVNYTHVPNARQINASFRDLSFDPGNKHHVPWVWGTTGLVYRSDLVTQPPVKWADLWTSSTKKAGAWLDRRSMFGMALMSLGYSVNTNTITEIDAAAAFLEERAKQQLFLETLDPYTSGYALADGTIEIALGWAYDAQTGRGLNENVTYLLPEEGTMLWVEVMAIPLNTKRQTTAEAFINFLLKPENAAIFTNEFAYATVVDGAQALIDETVLSDLTIFPTTTMLNGAELLQPLDTEASAALDAHWERLVALTNEEP